MEIPTEETLKPCPFCGPGGSVVTCYQDDCGYWKVGCGRCGSHSGVRPPSDPEGRRKVRELWNSRPGDQLTDLFFSFDYGFVDDLLK